MTYESPESDAIAGFIITIILFAVIMILISAVRTDAMKDQEIRETCKLVSHTRGFLGKECYLCPNGVEECF